MIHTIMSNPQVAAAIQKLLTDSAEAIGSVLGIVLIQVGMAIKNSHMGMFQKLIAERLVSYAEQTITGSDQDKANYVAGKLKDQFPSLNQEQVSHLMESAVLSVKSQLSNPAPQAPKGAPNA